MKIVNNFYHEFKELTRFEDQKPKYDEFFFLVYRIGLSFSKKERERIKLLVVSQVGKSYIEGVPDNNIFKIARKNGSTFHPKVYFFRDSHSQKWEAIIGSHNFVKNHDVKEISIHISDAEDDEDKTLYKSLIELVSKGWYEYLEKNEQNNERYNRWYENFKKEEDNRGKRIYYPKGENDTHINEGITTPEVQNTTSNVGSSVQSQEEILDKIIGQFVYEFYSNIYIKQLESETTRNVRKTKLKRHREFCNKIVDYSTSKCIENPNFRDDTSQCQLFKKNMKEWNGELWDGATNKMTRINKMMKRINRFSTRMTVQKSLYESICNNITQR